VGLGDLTLLAARCGLGNGCGLSTACGFDTLGGGCACRLFGLAQRTSRRGVRFIRLFIAGSFHGLTRRRVRSDSGGFCFRLGYQRLFANLLCGAMPQLGSILAARGREVAILGSVQIRP
jgi:hypothetical protein